MDEWEVIALVEQKFDLAEQKFHRKFYRPAPQFVLKGATAGKANGKILKFHPLFMANEPDYHETVIHEVAHCVQKQLYLHSQPHGTEFFNINNALGGRGTRCHSYDISILDNRIAYKCGCMVHQVTKYVHNRIKSGFQYTCRKCKKELKPNFKIHLIDGREWVETKTGELVIASLAQGEL